MKVRTILDQRIMNYGVTDMKRLVEEMLTPLAHIQHLLAREISLSAIQNLSFDTFMVAI